MIIIRSRKDSSKNIKKEEQKSYQKIENNYKSNNPSGRKTYSLNKKPSAAIKKDKSYKNIPIKKLRIKTPQEESLNERNRGRKTFSHYQLTSSNNQKNKEENIPRRKNEVFPKEKPIFDKEYNLSEVYSNFKTLEKPFYLLSNTLKTMHNYKRNNPTPVNINIENNNKHLFKEELSNQRHKNYGTQSTITIPTRRILHKDRSQEEFKKRLFINPLDKNKRNDKAIVKTERNKNNISFINNNNATIIVDKSSQNKIVKKDIINNRRHYDSKQNNSLGMKKNKTVSNIIINRRNSNSNNIKDKVKGKEKEKDKDKDKNKEREKEKDKDRNKEREKDKDKDRNKEREKDKDKDRNKEKDKDKDRKRDKSQKKEENKREINRRKPFIKNNESKTNDSDEESENLDKIANSLSALNINPGQDFGQPKTPVFLSPLLFSSYHSKFKPSTYSTDNEFNKDDIIKAYAYNTNEGHVRDYNEDTITATKLIFNPKDKTDYAYFFGVYDGHGGDGCSLYLKKNLYKNIKEPTVKGLKNAIDETEKNFLEKVAINSQGNLDDESGSCGVMVLIKNRKCIIANVGDSRCVLYRNKRIAFSTRDHKPNTDYEKRRIELAGGSIYQTKANLELYQNGKLVEIPYRVNPGGLSVSRTFGDIESKDPKFGGKKGVVACLPDIVEFELCDDHNFLVIGCDGIFDVLSNTEIMECIKIVLRIHKNKKKKINELCGDFASMIIKSALAKESFDNVSCVVVVFNINDII